MLDVQETDNTSKLLFKLVSSKKSIKNTVCLDPQQPLISNFMSEVSESDYLINKLISENSELKSELKNKNKLPLIENGFLKNLVMQAQKKNKKYCQNLKYISLFIFLVGGRLLYESLQLNLPLPSVHTVLKFLSDSSLFVEADLRASKLLTFIQEHNLKTQVWLSEDATKIVSRVKYCSKSNTIIGLVLPLDKKTGMPEKNFFEFESIAKVQQFLDHYSKSEYAECFMATSLCDEAVSYCICLFATNNKFDSMDVINRVLYIKKDLSTHGVEMCGESHSMISCIH